MNSKSDFPYKNVRKTVSCLLLIFSIVLSAQLSPLRKLQQEAEFHFNRSEYALAIPYYEEYFETNQTDYESYDRLGVCYFRTKEYKKAQENFRRAALLCPVNDKVKLAGYYSNLSAAYSQLNDNEKAYQYALKAYNMDADQQTLFNAASMANNLGRCTEGLKLLDKTTLTKGNEYNALYGLCNLKTGNYEKSIAYYEEFFSRFDPETNKIDFIIPDEKMNLLKAYLSAAADLNNTLSKERIQKITDLYLHLSKDKATQKKMLRYFAVEVHDWSKSERATNLVKSLTNTNADQISTKDKFFLKLQDMDRKDIYKAADDYLKQNSITDEKELFVIKTFRYIGYLLKVIGEEPDTTLVISEADIKKLKLLFDDIYPKKSYSNEEMTEPVMIPLHRTLEIFRKIAGTSENHKIFAPTVQKIVGDFPNKETRDFINKLLEAGYLEN